MTRNVAKYDSRFLGTLYGVLDLIPDFNDQKTNRILGMRIEIDSIKDMVEEQGTTLT